RRSSLPMPNDALRDTLAERRWITALAEGDPNALGGLYELYGERIFRYAYRMLGNRTDAEDATAETFLRVLRRSAELRADGAFRTWLFRIARNLCIDKMRQHKLMELPPDAQYTGSEERATLRITVQQAIKELPAFEDAEPSHYMSTLRRTVTALKADRGPEFSEESYQRVLMKLYTRGAPIESRTPEPAHLQYHLPMQG